MYMSSKYYLFMAIWAGSCPHRQGHVCFMGRYMTYYMYMHVCFMGRDMSS